MAQFHRELGALLEYAARVDGRLLCQGRQRLGLGRVVRRPGRPAGQFRRNEDIIDCFRKAIWVVSGGHADLLIGEQALEEERCLALWLRAAE
ncbi:hypothetical protein [Microvirga massiliensis]|uniref:hypothetical protein n=1 Tax=Microvirga massiliensis TaxID=1033741 RepID=UPI003CC7EECD